MPTARESCSNGLDGWLNGWLVGWLEVGNITSGALSLSLSPSSFWWIGESTSLGGDHQSVSVPYMQTDRHTKRGATATKIRAPTKKKTSRRANRPQRVV